MVQAYFDIHRDIQFPCFCQACVVGKTESEMSQDDPRYCLACETLMKQDSDNPNTHTDVYQNLPCYSATEQQEDVIMVQPKKARPCGRPRKELPSGLIQELSEQGLSIRQLVDELKTQDKLVSIMTVSRVLSGQRL